VVGINYFYPPGEHPGRGDWTSDKYSPHQEAVYQAVSKAVYAAAYGFGNTLRPTPGAKIDMEDFQRWQQKALKSWETENRSRGTKTSRGILEEDFPDSLWFWLYQRVRDAPRTLAPVSGIS